MQFSSFWILLVVLKAFIRACESVMLVRLDVTAEEAQHTIDTLHFRRLRSYLLQQPAAFYTLYKVYTFFIGTINQHNLIGVKPSTPLFFTRLF